ncbi:MAG: YigZ family protein [Bacteroidota bacterium]
MIIDNYKTIEGESYGEFKDKGSKFYAYAFPVEAEADVTRCLQIVKKEHFKARHHCYAYRVGLDKNNFRANDDGEPSSTAGKPILGQIDSFGLTNVLIVVVRYFGGTKLGVSGLINAYRTSAAAALQAAVSIEKTIQDIYEITFQYAVMGDVMNAIKKLNVEMRGQDFGAVPKLHIAIRKSEVDDTLIRLKAQIAKISVEEASTLETFDLADFVYLKTL